MLFRFYTNSLTWLQIMLISDEVLTFNGDQVNNSNTLIIYSKILMQMASLLL